MTATAHDGAIELQSKRRFDSSLTFTPPCPNPPRRGVRCQWILASSDPSTLLDINASMLSRDTASRLYDSFCSLSSAQLRYSPDSSFGPATASAAITAPGLHRESARSRSASTADSDGW